MREPNVVRTHLEPKRNNKTTTTTTLIYRYEDGDDTFAK